MKLYLHIEICSGHPHDFTIYLAPLLYLIPADEPPPAHGMVSFIAFVVFGAHRLCI